MTVQDLYVALFLSLSLHRPATDKQGAERVGRQFYTACRDVGFAYLMNTGFPQEMVERMFVMSKAFFELPQEVKMTVPHPPQGDQHRSVPSRSLAAMMKRKRQWMEMVLISSGYSGIGVEQVSQMVFDEAELAKLRQNAPDFKESYDMGQSHLSFTYGAVRRSSS